MNPSFRRITQDSAIDWSKVDPLIRSATNLGALAERLEIHVVTLSKRRARLGLEPMKRGPKPRAAEIRLRNGRAPSHARKGKLP